MKLNTLLTLNAIAALLFALLAWVAPAQLLSTYGAVTDPTGHLMTRYFGAMLVGNVLWLWLARWITEPGLRRWVIITTIVNWLAILIVNLWGIVTGLTNATEWTNVILALLFLVGYGYCWVKPSLQAA